MSHPLVVHCKKSVHDVYVGRPSKWGNPFSHDPGTITKWKVDSREEAIACFEVWIQTVPGRNDEIRSELRGKILGCWCAPKDCHADILARIANEVTC